MKELQGGGRPLFGDAAGIGTKALKAGCRRSAGTNGIRLGGRRRLHVPSGRSTRQARAGGVQKWHRGLRRGDSGPVLRQDKHASGRRRGFREKPGPFFLGLADAFVAWFLWDGLGSRDL